MSDETTRSASLTRDALFRMFAEEASRDGVLEEFEMKVLLNMARFLRLENDEARQILLESRERFQQGLLGEQRPLEPRALYKRVFAAVYADGKVDHLEEQMLAGLRKMFNISAEEHEAFLKDVIPAGKAPETTLPPHQPGSTTGHLAERLDCNPQNAWFKDHCNWYQAQQNASDPAKQVWKTFLSGLRQNDENEVYNALDVMDDILSSLEAVSLADVVLALGVLRWSRVLLKTDFSADQSGPARVWPGKSAYEKISLKMSPVLISIDHLRIRSGLEEWLSMVFVHLMEDLCMLVDRCHAEPMPALGSLIRMLFRVAQKAGVTHRAADLIAPLSARAFRQGCEISERFVEVCQEICDVQPQNHPLVVEADRAIRSISPEKSRFPKNYLPPTSCPSAHKPYEPALQRLERLVAEVNRKHEAETLLTRGLVEADLCMLDEMTKDVVQSSLDNGLSPALSQDRYIVAMVLPELKEYPRPVVAFFAIGNPSSHHEELKGGWVKILLKPLEGGSVQVSPDFPVFPSTAMLSIPLREDGVHSLKKALHSSGGAYDVALVGPGRKSARIWHQVGDLDPTGNLYRIERELLPADNNTEALSCLDDAIAGQPWLSGALMHKGLIAKRAGDMVEARAILEQAAVVQPHDPYALTRLGVLDKNELRMESSEEYLLKSLRILPVQPSAMLTLASSLLGQLAGGESSALPMFEYYIAGLHASQNDGQDYKEITEICSSLDPGLTRNATVIPVDSVFYL